MRSQDMGCTPVRCIKHGSSSRNDYPMLTAKMEKVSAMFLVAEAG